jgi:hypothetical protein
MQISIENTGFGPAGTAAGPRGPLLRTGKEPGAGWRCRRFRLGRTSMRVLQRDRGDRVKVEAANIKGWIRRCDLRGVGRLTRVFAAGRFHSDIGGRPGTMTLGRNFRGFRKRGTHASNSRFHPSGENTPVCPMPVRILYNPFRKMTLCNVSLPGSSFSF